MKKKFPSIIYFLFLVLYLEIVYRFFVLDNIFSFNTLSMVLFSMPFVFLFSIITSLFNEKINKILAYIITIFLPLTFISQLVYYSFYNSMFSIYSVKAGTGQVFGDFLDSILIRILENIVPIILLLLPIILFIVIFRKIFIFKKDKISSLIYSIAFIIVISIKVTVILYDTKDMYSFYRLYNYTHSPMITINKAGLLSTEIIDFKRYLFGFEDKLYMIKFNDDIILEDEVLYNKVDIDFDSLILNESDETIKSMHEYFNSVVPTKQNKYTGMFKGKNLIYITAEGFDKIAVDESLTPTLYKLVNNGFVFNNYYQPLFGVSTSDGEYMYMNGLIPKDGVWSFSKSSNIYLPYALGNVFKRLGYSSVNAYHGHTYTYYDRELSHPNMGFNYKGCGNGLEKLMDCDIWPESDLDMVSVTIEDYINEDNFMIYYMTISGHLNYTFVGNSMSYKNRDLVKDLPYSSNVKAYLAANIELDKALEKLISSLEEHGKLDDTVIVLSPDHYPYGLSSSELNEISDEDRADKFNMYHTNLIIYNSGMKENVVVNKYVSSIDVLPTVYNLFGVEYDSRLIMGRDALSDSEGLVMLSDRSWINENGKYNSLTDEFVKFKDVDDGYVNSINYEVYQKFAMSSLLLYEKNGVFYDYYRKIGI